MRPQFAPHFEARYNDAMSPQSPRDTLANRLIAIGCLLLTVPCVLIVVATILFGSPVVWSILPLGLRPVVAAKPGEALVLVAGLEGTAGTDPTDQIYQALLDASEGYGYTVSYYNSRVRIGRLADVPLSDQDARSLGQDYNASVVLWGTYDTSTEFEVNCSVLDPTARLEPDQFTLTVPQGNSTALDELATLALSIALYHTGDYTSADALLNSISSTLNPEIITFYQAETSQKIGNPTKALSIVDTALSGDSQNAFLLALKASVLTDLARYEEALETAEASQKLEPDRVETYLIRGTIYQRMGNTESALADLNQVLDLEPDNNAALYARAQLYETLGETQSALADYRSLIEREPSHYQYLIARARLYARGGDRARALADFDLALELAGKIQDPNTARQEILEARARAYRDLGDYSLALQDYDELKTIAPYAFPYLLEQGMVYWEMGDKTQAKSQWAAGMREAGYGEDAPGYNNVAWELAMAGYYEPAMIYSNQSLDLDPNEPHSQHTRGYIHLKLQEYQAALDDFEQALRAGSNLSYPPIYRDMADAYFGLGRYEQAIENYRTYLSLTPDAEDRYEVERQIEAAQKAVSGD